MIKDEQWPRARLIPISSASGIEAQERRATSALLAVLAAVPEFGRALLKPLGAIGGKIETFIEIPFKVGERSIRPDGIIAVTRGSKSWGALVETKTSNSQLERDQVEIYLDLARENKFDALISISNQYVTTSSAYPIAVDRRKASRVKLAHWSWVNILTEAVVQKQYRGVTDPDQAYMLEELIRYLSDPRSGAVAFDNMGPSWTSVRDAARDRTLRKSDAGTAAVAHRWDDLMRYLCLDLTKELGRDVRQSVAANERDPRARQQALQDFLAAHGQLYAELVIPDAAAPIRVVADLAARKIVLSARLDAPKAGTSKGRVSWLLRQLPSAPMNLAVEARMARTSESLAELLGKVRENPQVLYPGRDREIRQFVLSFTRDMGMKRDAGRGSFIESVLSSVKSFYGDVLQTIVGWKPKAPRLSSPMEPATAEGPTAQLNERITDAVIVAAEEIQQKAERPYRMANTQEDETESL